ncbi:unnamed protein product [Effrenium voratum]|nr:unnamed protein product [Effrenium voratum]
MADLRAVADAWTSEIWAQASADVEKIKGKPAVSKAEGAIGACYQHETVLQALRNSSTKEARNFASNITWCKIPLSKSTDITMSATDVTVSALDKIVYHLWAEEGSFKLKTPLRWPKGANVTVALTSLQDQPVKGELNVVGGELLILAWYRMLALARVKGTAEHDVDAILLFGRNMPLDFQHLAPDDPAFLQAAALCESFEFLREHFGLDVWKYMELVVSTRKYLRTLPAFGEVNEKKIADYLCEKVSFQGSRKPTPTKVKDLLSIAEELSKAPKAKRAIQLLTAEYGRSTIFEDFTKVLALCQRCKSSAELEFVTEGLVVLSLRTNNADAPSKSQLLAKAGEIAVWCFIRKLGIFFLKNYVVDCDTDAQRDLLARAKAIMSAPLQYHKEFPPNSLPEHGLSWISALPKPMSMLFNFWRKTVAGQFNQGLKGILGSPPQGGVSPESFLAVESVKGEWHKVLQAYDEYRKGKDAAEASQPDAAVAAPRARMAHVMIPCQAAWRGRTPLTRWHLFSVTAVRRRRTTSASTSSAFMTWRTPTLR